MQKKLNEKTGVYMVFIPTEVLVRFGGGFVVAII